MGKVGLVTTVDVPPFDRPHTTVFTVDRFVLVSTFASLPDDVFAFLADQLAELGASGFGGSPEHRAAVELLGDAALAWQKARA